MRKIVIFWIALFALFTMIQEPVCLAATSQIPDFSNDGAGAADAAGREENSDELRAKGANKAAGGEPKGEIIY